MARTKKGVERFRTALVLEDELPLQNAIKFKLIKEGFDVVSARNVEQAVGYMEDIENIDFVWLDHYLLGKETGFDFVSKIKANKKWCKIPLFVVSNTASPEKIKFYLDLGVEKCYTKSNHRLDKIIKDINKILDKNNK